MLAYLVARTNGALSLICAALFIIAGVSACAQSTNNTLTGTPIKIGLSVSLSGDFSDDGKALERGYELWADAVNQNGGLLGRPVQLDILNDKSDPTQVAANYKKMITVNHDSLVMGPYSSLLTKAAAPVTDQYHYALIEGAGTAPGVFQQNFKDLFSVSLSASNYLTSFVFYILSMPQAQRPQTVAYATSDDFFTQPQVQAAQAKLEQGGMRTVLSSVFPATTTNYAPVAQQIINAKPDVVILGTTGQSDCVALIKAFEKQHFNPKVIIATAGPDQGSQFTGPIGGTSQAEGVFVPNNGWFPTINTYQNPIFTQDYVAKYGGTVNEISADSVEAFSVGQVLQQAVEKIQSLDNTKLIQELHADNTFNSLQGPVQFANDGENVVAEPFLFQWQSGKLIAVYPTNAAEANPEYPKKLWK